jgi:hypothetical protein
VGFVRHPVDSALPNIPMPLAGALIKGIKKPE